MKKCGAHRKERQKHLEEDHLEDLENIMRRQGSHMNLLHCCEIVAFFAKGNELFDRGPASSDISANHLL